MRCALLLAAGCVVCLSQPALAAIISIKLAKPDTSYSQFLNDRKECLGSARYTHWHDTLLPSARLKGGLFNMEYDLHAFAVCMDAKGYRGADDGYDVGFFRRTKGGRFVMLQRS